MSILVVQYRTKLVDSIVEFATDSRAFELTSGNVTPIRINYLSDPLYLFEESNGFMSGGEPTQKLINYIDYAENIAKGNWGTLLPNESRYNNKTPFDGGFSDIIPTFFDIETDDTPWQNGIGDHDNLELIDILAPLEIEPILPIHFPKLYMSGTSTWVDTAQTLSKDFGIDENTNDYYVPKLEPGYFYFNNTEYYLYANKVTEIFMESDGIVSGEATYYYLSGEPRNISPIFAEHRTTIPNIDTLCGSETITEYRMFKSKDHQPDNSTWVNIHPYSPMYKAEEYPLLCKTDKFDLTGHDKTDNDLILSGVTFYDTVKNAIVIPGSGYNHCIVTYEDVDAEYCLYMGLNLSPLTADDDYRTVSLVDEIGSGEGSLQLVTGEYSTEAILDPIFTSYPTPANTLPLSIIVRDANGVPVPNTDVNIDIYRPLYDSISGTTPSNALPRLVTPNITGLTMPAGETIDNVVMFDRYNLNHEGWVYDQYGRKVGYSYPDTKKIDLPSIATLYNGTTVKHNHEVSTNEYGSLNIELVPNKVYRNETIRISAYTNNASGQIELKIKPTEEGVVSFDHVSDPDGEWITQYHYRSAAATGHIVSELEGQPLGGVFGIGAFDLSEAISGVMNGLDIDTWFDGTVSQFTTELTPFDDVVYWDSNGERKFGVVNKGLNGSAFMLAYHTTNPSPVLDRGDSYGN